MADGAGEAIRTLDPNLGKVMLYPWATPASFKENIVLLGKGVIRNFFPAARAFLSFYNLSGIASSLEASASKAIW